jgi:uncharacterized delta-60 repeat protein
MPATVFARAGMLDASFGVGGIATAPGAPGTNEYHLGVTIERDGRIVVTGNANPYTNDAKPRVRRYLPDGTLDPTFGDGGLVVPVVPYWFDNMNGSPTRDAAGNVVVSGALFGPSLDRGTFVLRLDPSGKPDPSFGTGGMVVLWPTPPSRVRVFGPPTLQPDGKIVLAGSDGDAASFMRLETDGSFDTSFGDGGVIHLPLAGGEGRLFRTRLLADGRMVSSGTVEYPDRTFDVLVARVDANGSPDGAFGLGGLVVTDFGGPDDFGFGIDVQADGKVVVGGNRGIVGAFATVIARYGDSGALDPAFAVGGMLSVDITPFTDYVEEILVEPSGKILFAGQYDGHAGAGSMLLGRLHPDGSFDRSFGTHGITVVDSSPEIDHLASLARRPDGAIVGVGSSGQFGGAGARTDGVVLRFLGSRCDDVPRSICAPVTVAGRGRLQLKRGSTSARDTLTWTWRKGVATPAALGDPTTTTDYALCVYDGGTNALLYEESAYAGRTCGTRACWLPRGAAGFVYVDRGGSADGVTKVALKSGADGKSAAMLRAKGERLTLPVLPLALPTRVQLQASSGTCFDTVFSSAGASINTAAKFVGKPD